MGEQDKEHQFVQCQCGKTLRLKISEKKYGKKVTAICPNCKTKHVVTILPLEIPDDNLNADFKEIEPYAEMLKEKLNQIMEEAGNRKDIVSLRKLFSEKGFGVGVVVFLGIAKNGNGPEQDSSEAANDADFLKKMKIRYD